MHRDQAMRGPQSLDMLRGAAQGWACWCYVHPPGPGRGMSGGSDWPGPGWRVPLAVS